MERYDYMESLREDIKDYIKENMEYLEGKDEQELYNVYILQSYDSKVVKITNNRGCYQCITLGRDWDYSTTTSKHVYAFLDVYSKVKIYGVTNKRKYIRDLIEEYKNNREKFLDEHNFAICYDEEMV